MKKTDNKQRFNKNSIKVRLLIIPIIVVVLSVVAIELISTTSSKKALLSEMASNGEFTLREFIQRIEDNTASLEVINTNIENDIRTAVNVVQQLEKTEGAQETEGVEEETVQVEGQLNNKLLTDLAKSLEISELNYFDKTGTIIYSNLPENLGWQPDANHPLTPFRASNDNEMMEEIRESSVNGLYYK